MDHIDVLLKYFPRSQILILLSDDYRSKPKDVMEQIGTFLGVSMPKKMGKPLLVNVDRTPTHAMQVATEISLRQHFNPFNDRLFRFLNRTNLWPRIVKH